MINIKNAVVSSLQIGEDPQAIKLVYFDMATDEYNIIHLNSSRSADYMALVHTMFLDDIAADLRARSWTEIQDPPTQESDMSLYERLMDELEDAQNAVVKTMADPTTIHQTNLDAAFSDILNTYSSLTQLVKDTRS